MLIKNASPKEKSLLLSVIFFIKLLLCIYLFCSLPSARCPRGLPLPEIPKNNREQARTSVQANPRLDSLTSFLSGLPAQGSHEILPCAALSVKRKIADNTDRRVCVKSSLPLGRSHTVTINGDHHICRHSESSPLSLRHSGRR